MTNEWSLSEYRAWQATQPNQTDRETGRPLCNNPKCPLASTLYSHSSALCAYCLGRLEA